MRRRRPEKRQVLPDPVYNDILVTKFVNYVMECGKKGVAEKIFYGAMETIKQIWNDHRKVCIGAGVVLVIFIIAAL